jgi:hypothetical protein
MIYTLRSSKKIDTSRELNFEERHFIQKMLIYEYMGMDLETFRRKWRNPDNPVWPGQSGLHNASPAVQILLDLEEKIKDKK